MEGAYPDKNEGLQGKIRRWNGASSFPAIKGGRGRHTNGARMTWKKSKNFPPQIIMDLAIAGGARTAVGKGGKGGVSGDANRSRSCGEGEGEHLGFLSTVS